jgi:hypothetical protein
MGVSTRRKIWQRFAKLLKDDDDQAEIEENIDELKKLPLNGRQIRNVLNIAQTLAVSSESRLKYEHIKKAADKTVAFGAFFQNADGSNSSSAPKSRLRKNFERSDSFKSHSNEDSDEE